MAKLNDQELRNALELFRSVHYAEMLGLAELPLWSELGISTRCCECGG